MGSKSSHHHHDSDINEYLSKKAIEELCHDTGFTEEELLNWHTNFYKDCPDGKLTLKQFEHEYSKIMGKPTQKTNDYIKHMFNVYDQDKNQFIDFREFVMALSAASVVNRLRLVETLFSMFDLDNDGKVTKTEMSKMLHTLVDVTNSNKKRRHHHHNDHDREINLEKRIDDAFNELNTNDDDHITQDEFIEWYIKSGLLSDVKSNEINLSDTSHIQQLDKKNRKIKKQQLKSSNNKEEKQQQPQLVRYMSHMTEQKSISTTTMDDNDNENRYLDDHSMDTRTRIDSDDSDSHHSKENERWQHMFNSVLGQIRAQRPEDEDDQHDLDLNPPARKSHFNSWKKQGEEKLKVEYYKQKSNETPSTSDIVTIRL